LQTLYKKGSFRPKFRPTVFLVPTDTEHILFVNSAYSRCVLQIARVLSFNENKYLKKETIISSNKV